MTKESIFKPFLFALGYAICFYLLQFFLAKTGTFINEPSDLNLKSWDVGFYDSIAHSGYDYDSRNTGFFILFPIIWKWTHLGIWGITFLNIIFFSLGFAFLVKTLNIYDKIFWLLCLSIPSVYFAFLPYTESLFFLLASLILYGIKSKNFWLTWVSLLLIALLRATAVFFLPALLLTELLSNPIKLWFNSIVAFSYKYALPCLLGLGIFILCQYLATGIWFAYFKTQSSFWGHKFSIPEFPFSNIENGDFRYHWLSALALFIDVIAIFILTKQIILWAKGKLIADKGLIFSLVYLAITLIWIICFNPKSYKNTSMIMGANRYTFITPFFFYLIHYLHNQFYSVKNILICLLAAAAFWQLFDGYDSLVNFIRVGLIPLMLLLAFMLYAKNGRKDQWLMIGVIMFNFLIQMHLFQQFITPLYVD